MLKTIVTGFLFIILFADIIKPQSISVFNPDISAFPLVKAKFYAFDVNGNQIINFQTSDFSVIESGLPRKVIKVNCPNPSQPIAVSSVLTIDVSGSMSFGKIPNMTLAVEAAKVWINELLQGKSECAITSFSNVNYLNQDFTSDKNFLLKALNDLIAVSGTNYNAALIEHSAGGLLIAKKGKYKKVLVMLTDGGPETDPDETAIINMAVTNNISMYFVTLNMPAPNCIKRIASRTGGLWFENIKTIQEAKDAYIQILFTAQRNSPCEIEWLSEPQCKSASTKADINLLQNNTESNIEYTIPDSMSAFLEFVPGSVKFNNVPPGTKKDSIIKVTARNANFTVTSVNCSNPAFTLNPSSFSLNSGNSINLTLSYTAPDSNLNINEYQFINDLCPQIYTVSGGFKGRNPKNRTLEIIQPNGKESFEVGSDTLITWQGVLPEEKIRIEYSTDKGISWKIIADSVTGLSYLWKVPKTISNQCLARVTSNFATEFTNPNVVVCEQEWMGSNLDVDHYRNGDIIPEVQDGTAWTSLTTGAWCWLNNDESNSRFGRLYNWYAVHDPRGLAPPGWHIPTDAEWTELENCLGGANVAGGKLKENGFDNWASPNTGATNESGFTALPGGFRFYNGFFKMGGANANFWTSTEGSALTAWSRFLGYDYPNINRAGYYVTGGFSVRCVKDE